MMNDFSLWEKKWSLNIIKKTHTIWGVQLFNIIWRFSIFSDTIFHNYRIVIISTTYILYDDEKGIVINMNFFFVFEKSYETQC